ncbi:MAG TPA: sulfate/molybdate ABC transporter ATP-binding protein [Kofleriaceae bacterium]|nr:sulfate/molybdate ABC transporter ATP-binding protein [Kofleriaceae bacterium]
MNVVVRNITKLYARTPAIRDVSFEVVPGRLTALLGPSGSGKTTLLRCIAGLETVDAGTITIDGEDVTMLPPRARRLGMVFQSYALFGHMTVAKNIAYGLKIARVPPAERRARVAELLELVQLSGLGARMPSQLSGGQRQRVALARALAPRPRVLLLDEPFSALDAKVRRELRELTRRLHEELGVTTILVTHDQDEAMELADRLVVMNRGRIEQIGTPDEVYDEPASAFVAGFIGAANVITRPGPDGGRQPEYVRPHDVDLFAAPGEGDSGSDTATHRGMYRRAHIERANRVGGWVKVTVVLRDGQKLDCTLTRTAFEDLGVKEGDPVSVDTSRARLFVPDYSI